MGRFLSENWIWIVAVAGFAVLLYAALKHAPTARFLRENWIWIVAPIVIAVLLFVALILLMGGDESSPFNYNIW